MGGDFQKLNGGEGDYLVTESRDSQLNCTLNRCIISSTFKYILETPLKYIFCWPTINELIKSEALKMVDKLIKTKL